MISNELDPQDQSHLKLLEIFYYIMGVLLFLAALLPTVHITVGLTMIFSPESMASGNAAPPPPFMGWMFVTIGAFVMVLLASLALCQIIVARSIRGYKRHMFCLVIAGVNCMNVPIGTALGVFTFFTLLKPHIKALFDGPALERSPYRD